MCVAPALLERYMHAHTASRAYMSAHRIHLCDNRNIANFSLPYKDTIHPIIAAHGLGSRVVDVDENELIDVGGGFGPILFGHNAPFVRDAVCSMMAEDGWALGFEHEVVGEASRKFCQLTGNERVAWVNTGTEATTLAMRLCRLHTSRQKIVMFLGSYHGHFDGFLGIPTSMTALDKCVPLAGGISRGFVQDLVVLEFDEVRSLEWIEEHAGEVAGVFCEAIQNRNPSVVARPFLRKLRELTAALDIVLVFDEVVTGFRIGPGGAQQNLGIRADLVSYGKALGGGFPVGALGGRADIMAGVDGGVWRFGDASAPKGKRTYFAGTMCKHPLVMAAVNACFDRMIEEGGELYTVLNANMMRLTGAVNEWWAQQGLALRIDNYGSQFRFVVPPDLGLAFYQTLSLNGVYCWEARTCYLYTVHTEADLAHMIEAAKRTTVALLANGVELPRVET
eukprot:2676108-Prymnesium_polylepis.1